MSKLHQLLIGILSGGIGLICSSSAIFADIGHVTPEPAIKVSEEASPNEFPRTVGTVSKENSGFEVTWNNASGFTDFFDKLGKSIDFKLSDLDIFGLFTNKSDKAAKIPDQNTCKLQHVTNQANNSHSIYKVTPNQVATATLEQNKLEEVAELSHHDQLVELRSADDLVDNTVAAAKDDTTEQDWRYKREWWQRGTPIL